MILRFSLFCVILSLFISNFNSVDGLKHHLKINHDQRPQGFFIENFGFEAGGRLEMIITNFKIGETKFTSDMKKKVGFIIKRTTTDATALIGENPETEDKSDCLERLFDEGDTIVQINDTNFGEVTTKYLTIKDKEEGFYNTYFIRCVKEPISFELSLIQYNIDSRGNINYLSSGFSTLPTLYGAFTIAFVVSLIVWIFGFIRSANASVNRIHHLMTVLLILKLLSLFFQTIEYHYIKTTGSASGWNVLYYIFACLKGIMLFILIALIGTGWTFIKPFLSEKDKKIFLFVIPLQILDNIALIIIEETAPGSQGWFTWKDIFRLVDFACCGAILIPIIWSIKHLREASQIDGKAALNMRKLKLFRQFYLMVVSYVYFTRIIVYLVDATLPFRLVWLGTLFTELATIIFFSLTGYKFRPAADNPYFSLVDEEEFQSGKQSQEMESLDK